MTSRDHMIELRPDAWTIEHPPTCTAGAAECPVSRAAAINLTGNVHRLKQFGRFACKADHYGRFLEIGQPEAAPSDAPFEMPADQ